MKPQERLYLLPLCKRIISEQNHDTFTDLILQLEVLLDFSSPPEEVKTSSC